MAEQGYYPRMHSLLSEPAFTAYVVMGLILSLNLLVVWAYSGAVRGKTKTAINKEDADQFKTPLVEEHPPEVARVLRAHANAEANIYPFLFLGLVFVLAGGSATTAEIIFGVFTLARVVHSFVYLAGKQPWRSLAYGVGGLATVALMVSIVLLLVRGPEGT
jgi:prostaglandin-E synthase 1